MGLESYAKGKAEQRAVESLYRLAGLWVYTLGRPGLAAGKRGNRGTMQTPGLPDLLVLGPGLCIWHEVKAGKARLSLPQRIFGVRWQAAMAPVAQAPGITYLRVYGGVDAAHWALTKAGLRDELGTLFPIRLDPGGALLTEALRRKRK
jgi:hypothetical protein